MLLPFFMLKLFEDYLRKEKRYSDHTVVAYIHDIQQFFDFQCISPEQIIDIQEVNMSLVRSWLVELVKSKTSPKSIQRKLSANRTFFKFLQTKLILEVNPFANIKGPKVPKRLPQFVQKQDIELNKIAPLFSDDLFGLRDKLLFELLYQTGIRLSECLNIKERDVTTTGLKVLGKRNKERIIALSPSLFNDIQILIKMKEAHNVNLEYIFFTNSQKKMYPKFVYRKINHYLSQISAMNKRSPHVLRHTFATHLLNEGASLEVLKEILGHANLAATQVYTHNSFEQISSIFKSAHPREQKN